MLGCYRGEVEEVMGLGCVFFLWIGRLQGYWQCFFLTGAGAGVFYALLVRGASLFWLLRGSFSAGGEDIWAFEWQV